MELNQPQVEISYDPMHRLFRVWIFENHLDQSYNYNLDPETGVLLKTPYNKYEANELKPFLELSYIMKDLLFNAILQFMEQNGVKTENQNRIEGKLSAVESHLSDMREITTKLLNSKLGIK